MGGMTTARQQPEPGQVWEHSRGRNVGARFEVLRQVDGFPDWWVVRSLTAKWPTVRESYWPDLTRLVRLVSTPEPEGAAPRDINEVGRRVTEEGRADGPLCE